MSTFLLITNSVFVLVRIKQNLFFFASKWRAKSIRQLDINYKDINIKQRSKVTHLGCVLEEKMSGEI